VGGAAGAWRFDGKVALVTGATRGIGRAIAEALLHAGAAVCVTARKQPELDEALAALAPIGPPVTVFRGSAGDPEAAAGAVAACVEGLGGLDLLVNNAATNPQFGPLVDADPGAVRKILEVNVEGPLRHVQAAWHGWMAEHGGVVLNVVSVGGLRPSPGIGAYNVSKAALTHLTRQLAAELAPTVRVNALAPGLIRTDFSQVLWADEERAAALQPLRRLGTPADCAAAALYLLSDAAGFVTGETLVVDGGTVGAGWGLGA
jgi:3-oxoacyl-[acyl-carrier protein] reductase